MVFLGKEVAVWFRADQGSAGIIPSHFQPYEKNMLFPEFNM